jgi:hypothetical protein
MKRVIVLSLTFCLLSVFSFGCATREYVQQQIEPLMEKISKCESKCDKSVAAQRKAFELQQQK